MKFEALPVPYVARSASFYFLILSSFFFSQKLSVLFFFFSSELLSLRQNLGPFFVAFIYHLAIHLSTCSLSIYLLIYLFVIIVELAAVSKAAFSLLVFLLQLKKKW